MEGRKKGYHAQILHQRHPTLTHCTHHKRNQGHPNNGQKERNHEEILTGSSCKLAKGRKPGSTMLTFGNHMAEEPGNGEFDI